MKKTAIIVLGALLLIPLLVACSTDGVLFGTVTKVPRCEKVGATWQYSPSNVQSAYQPLSSSNCVVYMPPSDQAGWFESRLNSRRLRGQDMIALGCTHCPQGNKDCVSPNNCGGCNYITLYFDFSKFPEDSEIASAKVALFALDYPEIVAQAIVEGRVNVGGDYQVISEVPTISGNWVLFDITPFACRSVVERRNSVSIDLSLPCGSDYRAHVAKVGLRSASQPTLIVEYK